MDDSFAQRYFSGEHLYGDDLDEDGVRRWLAEECGYYDLYGDGTAPDGCAVPYEYHALNEFHGYRHLRTLRFSQALAIGCGQGDDIAPIADRIGHITAVEPEKRWWRDRIGGTPATYHAPDAAGTVPAGTGTIGLTVCLGALHHIPTVTRVLGEIARATAPGGLFLLREPVSTMGDWRKPRPGLTRNERGLPLAWLDRTLDGCGFRPVHRNLCMFPATPRLAGAIGVKDAYNRKAAVLQDHALSRISAWNYHYHRTSLWQKLAPASVFYVLQKRG